LADQQIKRLQSVLNAAARLETSTQRTDHVTLVLLPVNTSSTRLQCWCISAWIIVDHSTLLTTAVGLATADQVHMQQTATYWTSLGSGQPSVIERLPSPRPRVCNSLPQSSRDPCLANAWCRRTAGAYQV